MPLVCPRSAPSAAFGRRGVALAALALGAAAAAAAPAPLPERLSATGLYADAATKRIADGLVAFTPQYPLWSDGATKRRWMSLPPGTFVDASDPDAWEFPVGTVFWKEFAFSRRVETRVIARTEEGWTFATYRWLGDESDAILAGESGERGVAEIAPGVGYDLPSRYDCRACHEGNVSRVLGFSTLQLSGDRDPGAPHGEPLREGDVDLAALVARGLVRGLPPSLVAARIPADSETERSALGYLAGNCANCHNDRGALADLGFSLEVRFGGGAEARAFATALGRVSKFQPAGEAPSLRLAAGHPEGSAVVRRMSRRDPITRMPPMGSKIVDRAAVELLEGWLRERPPAPESKPAVVAVQIEKEEK